MRAPKSRATSAANLPCHRVGDEQDLSRLDSVANPLKLGHHVFIYVEAAGRVDDDDVVAGTAGVRDALAADRHGVLAVLASVHRHADGLAELRELIDGCGTIDVGGDQMRMAAPASSA